MMECRNFRIQLLLKCFLWTLPLSILSIYFFINVDNNVYFFTCFVFTCLFILIPFSIYNQEFNEQMVKDYVLPNLRKKCKSISYDKDNTQHYEPIWKPINKTFGTYLHSWKDIHNILSGKMSNLNYKIADSNASARFGCHYFTSFYGQVIEIDFKKFSFNNEVCITPQRLYNKSFRDGLFVNKEFMIKKHIVYTKNNDCNIPIFLILKNFLENYNKKMHVKFMDNKILIMINSNSPLLDRFNLIRLREYDYSNINMIFDLIRQLNNLTISDKIT